MNPKTKNIYLGVVALAFFSLIAGVFGAVPFGAPQDSVVTYENGTSIRRADYFVIEEDLFYNLGGTYYNITSTIENLLGLNATNEWGVVYGTTGDWFNYADLSGATPVYIGLQMHPLNHTVGGELVIPEVYDLDDTHWQLGLYWLNGSQVTADCLVMYYAHIDYDNPTGLTYIEPNGQ